MHDKKGRLIEVGDHVKVKPYGSAPVTIGRVTSVAPGAETCNMQAVHLVPGYYPLQQVTASTRDSELVLKADGSEPSEPPA